MPALCVPTTIRLVKSRDSSLIDSLSLPAFDAQG